MQAIRVSPSRQRLRSWQRPGPIDYDQGIRVVRPIFATGVTGLEPFVHPAVKVGRRVLGTAVPQPGLVLVQVLGHDFTVVDAHEKVANRKLAGIGQSATRPEQLGECRGKAGTLRPPCAVD